MESEKTVTFISNRNTYTIPVGDNNEKAGRLCSRFGRQHTQNTNDLCRVSGRTG